MHEAIFDAPPPPERPADDQLGLGLLRSGLKLNHLRMIVAIDQHKQVSAAAAALSISQPAASRMLTEMESIIKVPLCERVSRGVELTQFGRAFARRARTILLELDEVDREIAALKSDLATLVTTVEDIKKRQGRRETPVPAPAHAGVTH